MARLCRPRYRAALPATRANSEGCGGEGNGPPRSKNRWAVSTGDDLRRRLNEQFMMLMRRELLPSRSSWTLRR
ncbi:hypothetical protein Dimus_015466 [Dionaea muscipula]